MPIVGTPDWWSSPWAPGDLPPPTAVALAAVTNVSGDQVLVAPPVGKRARLWVVVLQVVSATPGDRVDLFLGVNAFTAYAGQPLAVNLGPTGVVGGVNSSVQCIHSGAPTYSASVVFDLIQ